MSSKTPPTLQAVPQWAPFIKTPEPTPIMALKQNAVALVPPKPQPKTRRIGAVSLSLDKHPSLHLMAGLNSYLSGTHDGWLAGEQYLLKALLGLLHGTDMEDPLITVMAGMYIAAKDDLRDGRNSPQYKAVVRTDADGVKVSQRGKTTHAPAALWWGPVQIMLAAENLREDTQEDLPLIEAIKQVEKCLPTVPMFGVPAKPGLDCRVDYYLDAKVARVSDNEAREDKSARDQRRRLLANRIGDMRRNILAAIEGKTFDGRPPTAPTYAITHYQGGMGKLRRMNRQERKAYQASLVTSAAVVLRMGRDRGERVRDRETPLAE